MGRRICIGIGALGALGMLCIVDSPIPLGSWLLMLGGCLALTLIGAAGAWLCGEGRRSR